ncbi:MAG TPA: cytochrome c biogenesis protein/redoxin, partial [Pyrinomonadaceae bacterium]|nr:cytochrome c biogenesis protein/redoxin [Pyrinomonadaceae bacterium]
SPCVLPLVPGYISLISGVSIDRLKRPEGRSSLTRWVVINSLAFNAGLSLIFVSLGAAAGLVGSAVLSSVWVRVIGGLVIIAFGLQMIGLLKIRALYRDTRFFSDDKPRGPFGSLLLGIAFAAGWTPCIGPILGGIIGLAATSGGWKEGLVLSSFYAAGLAFPFLLTGLGINQFLSFYGNFRRHLHKVEVVSGAVLILIGATIASGYSNRLASSRLAGLLPDLESRLKLKAPTTPLVSKGSFTQAPQVNFATLDGRQLNLSDLRGRVVLLNFWASWCGPCRSEIPELNVLQQNLQAQGLTVVGVSWDDEAGAVREFQKELPQNYQIVLGGSVLQDKFDGVRSLPTTLVIDREGRVRNTIIGARDLNGFEAVVEPLLQETPGVN